MSRFVCVATILDSVGLARTFREKHDERRSPRIHCLSAIKANDNLGSVDRSIDPFDGQYIGTHTERSR